MKSLTIVIILLLLTIPAFAQLGNETITISTYYPSPHGVYGVLTMFPLGTEPEDPQEGDMYYNKSERVIKYYNDTAWVNITGGGGDADRWKWQGDHNINNTNTGSVGVGTTMPTMPFAKFHVHDEADNNIILSRNPGYGTTEGVVVNAVNDTNAVHIPVTFTGSKFYFHYGNVGIGTTNPQATLEVNGTVRFNNALSGGFAFMETYVNLNDYNNLINDTGAPTSLLELEATISACHRKCSWGCLATVSTCNGDLPGLGYHGGTAVEWDSANAACICF
jgi:hypothetical protein